MAIAEIARITGDPGHLATAKIAVENTLLAQNLTPALALYANAALAMIAVQEEDESAAAKHYDDLRGEAGTMLWTVTSVDRLLGRLSQIINDLEQSVAHFEDALSFSRKAGYRPELAWSCHDYADALLQLGGPGNREKAASLLDEGLSIAGELGMAPLVGKVTALQGGMLSTPAKSPAYPDGLSSREVEVLRLIAAGKTDREIGGELFISVRTAGHHVSNILNKTGSANRAEAATYAAMNGLTASPGPTSQ